MFFYLSLKQDDDWGNIKIKNVSIMLRTLIIMQLHNLPKYIPNAFFFSYIYPVVPTPSVENTFLFSLACVAVFLENQL